MIRTLIAAAVLVFTGTVAPTSAPAATATAPVAVLPSVAHVQALLAYSASIGDPWALTATVVQEQAHLATVWCPFAAGRTNQQLADFLDPDGTPAQIRHANEASMILWNGWCS